MNYRTAGPRAESEEDLDDAQVRELFELLEADELADFVVMFDENSLIQLHNAQAACRSSAWNELCVALHTMKGSASAVGATGLAAKCGALEADIRAGRLDCATEALSHIEALRLAVSQNLARRLAAP